MFASNHAKGVVFGALSAIAVTLYLTINRYIFLETDAPAVPYIVLFTIGAGVIAGGDMLIRSGQKHHKTIRTQANGLIAVAVMAGLATACVVANQNFTSNTNIAMLLTLIIVITSFASRVFLGARLRSMQIFWGSVLFVGVYLGIAGFSLITLSFGDVLCMVGVVLFGIQNAAVKPLLTKLPNHIVVDVRLVLAGMAALFLVLPFWSEIVGLFPVIGLIVLAAAVYWVGILLFFKAVNLIHPGEASVLNQAQLLMTVPLAVVLFQEPFSIINGIGLGIMCVAIVSFIRAGAPQAVAMSK